MVFVYKQTMWKGKVQKYGYHENRDENIGSLLR